MILVSLTSLIKLLMANKKGGCENVKSKKRKNRNLG